SPASYKRCPCRRGAGAISVGQTRSRSAMRAAIRSGGAATIRSCRILIFIRPLASPPVPAAGRWLRPPLPAPDALILASLRLAVLSALRQDGAALCDIADLGAPGGRRPGV